MHVQYNIEIPYLIIFRQSVACLFRCLYSLSDDNLSSKIKNTITSVSQLLGQSFCVPWHIFSRVWICVFVMDTVLPKYISSIGADDGSEESKCRCSTERSFK